ncbi:MAG: AIR synthase related protein, partial [Dehalococcoidia bacterium]
MKRFNENKIIKNILESSKLNSQPKYPPNLNLIKGIGDDAAYWKDDTYAYCTSTDSLVDNVHFKLDYFKPSEIGKKSIAVNLSDIAAMGATPLGLLVNLGITKNQDEE